MGLLVIKPSYPDLLVWNETEHFFIEVKYNRAQNITVSQYISFNELANLGFKIKIYYAKEKLLVDYDKKDFIKKEKIIIQNKFGTWNTKDWNKFLDNELKDIKNDNTP